MAIFKLEDKQEYLREVVGLTQREWGNYHNDVEFEEKRNKKVEKIIAQFNQNNFCILVLVENQELLGFISLLPSDGDEKNDLTPWYATMYVKEEHRGKGYSKKLNDAILKEAKERGFTKIYLKSDLVNYYEKFGARYLEKLNNGESLYCIDL